MAHPPLILELLAFLQRGEPRNLFPLGSIRIADLPEHLRDNDLVIYCQHHSLVQLWRTPDDAPNYSPETAGLRLSISEKGAADLAEERLTDRMADAPKADGQTSTGDDGDRALPTADEWRAEILAGQADELVRMDKAAGLIQMSGATIYRMIRAGLPCSPPITADCPRKARLMRRSDVLAWHRGTHPGMKTSKK